VKAMSRTKLLPSIILCTCLLPQTLLAHPPYPIIFIHGLTGSDETFEYTMQYLVGNGSNFTWGDSVNVYDVVLNADNDDSQAILESDVKWEDFWSGDRWIDVGRRNFAPGTNPDDGSYVHEWGNSDIYAVNFMEERIEGAYDPINDYFDYSNSSAIYKQGYALQQIISEVLQHTSADKVVLVGHSMGGLAIREYLQRIENSSHRWWIDPGDSESGHKVAKVVTIGTPHLGSNSWNVLRDREGFPPNPHSEAVRDLRYAYQDMGSWDPDYTRDEGIYLFGGDESNPEIEIYFNRDINCNGSIGDAITGINDGDANGVCNPSMPLPSNIDYTWITSDNGGLGDGDGMVRRSRQYLTTPGDTLLIHEDHGDEPDAVSAIIRGLDEPDIQDLAYGIELNRYYQGCITYQEGQLEWDDDFYAFSIDSYSSVDVVIDGPDSGVGWAMLSDGLGFSVFETISGFPFSMAVDLEPGAFTLHLMGIPTITSLENPYTFCIIEETELDFNEWVVTTVDEESDVGKYSSIAFGTNGQPVISYYDQTNGNLKYAERYGENWTTETLVDFGNVGQYTSLAIDDLGRKSISYYDYTHGALGYVGWVELPWEITTEFVENTTGPEDVGQYSSLSFDQTNNAVASYYDVENGNLKAATRYGSTWTTETLVDFGSVGQYTSLAIDDLGRKSISYYDYTHGALGYVGWVELPWEITTEFVENTSGSENVGQYSSLGFDHWNRPSVSYYDVENQNLKYAYRETSSWIDFTVDDNGNVGQYTSIALLPIPNVMTTIWISYYDVDNTALKLATGQTLGLDLPAPPGGMGIVITGEDAELSWCAVDTTIYGDPIEIDVYVVSYAEEVFGPYWYLAYTPETMYTHVGVVRFTEHMFYWVRAIGVEDPRTLSDDRLDPPYPMLIEDWLELLTNIEENINIE
jgi:pimeloyl-ACP methyl ester carboxylesterase